MTLNFLILLFPHLSAKIIGMQCRPHFCHAGEGIHDFHERQALFYQLSIMPPPRLPKPIGTQMSHYKPWILIMELQDLALGLLHFGLALV